MSTPRQPPPTPTRVLEREPPARVVETVGPDPHLDGLRGWLAEMERSIRTRTGVCLVLVALAIGAAAAAIYIALDEDEPVSESGVQEARIDALESDLRKARENAAQATEAAEAARAEAATARSEIANLATRVGGAGGTGRATSPIIPEADGSTGGVEPSGGDPPSEGAAIPEEGDRDKRHTDDKDKDDKEGRGAPGKQDGGAER